MHRRIAKKLLDEGLSLMTDFDVWVDAGTLLGLYRDNSFIPHDTDVDFAVSLSTSQISQVPILSGPDRLPLRSIYWRGLPMQHAYLIEGEVLDFYFFYDDLCPNLLTNVSDAGVMQIPRPLIMEINTDWQWDNMKLPIPRRIEDYLVWRYGEDWHIPKLQKAAWSNDHPNLNSLDKAATILWQPSIHGISGDSGIFNSYLVKENRDTNALGLTVFSQPGLLSLWASATTIGGERDSLQSERDSLRNYLDEVLSSKCWRYTRIFRKQ